MVISVIRLNPLRLDNRWDVSMTWDGGRLDNCYDTWFFLGDEMFELWITDVQFCEHTQKNTELYVIKRWIHVYGFLI